MGCAAVKHVTLAAVKHVTLRLAPEAGTAASWVWLSLLMCRLCAAQPQALVILQLNTASQRLLQSINTKRYHAG